MTVNIHFGVDILTDHYFYNLISPALRFEMFTFYQNFNEIANADFEGESIF